MSNSIQIPGLIQAFWFIEVKSHRVAQSLQIVLLCLYSTPSHYHHCAKLSEDIELIRCLSDIYLSSVWVRLSIFSQLPIIQPIIKYVGLCVFSLPTPLVMIEIIYILCLIIIIKSEVWTITHCLGLGHETMVCAVCLSIFLWHHQMETFSVLLATCAGIHRWPVNSPHKGQWRGALVLFLICAGIKGWVNSRGAGDLRCRRAHYNVTVMRPPCEKYNAHLLVFTRKMSILTDLTDMYIMKSISGRI